MGQKTDKRHQNPGRPKEEDARHNKIMIRLNDTERQAYEKIGAQKVRDLILLAAQNNAE